MPTISSLHAIQNIPLAGPITPAAGGGSGSDAFSSILQQSMQNVSQLQNESDTSVNQFLSGENDDPHTMMLAVQRSSLAFDMFVQVRNKVVQAYQEVMKIPE
jgi:flagellar hook-basal body complex protein FliE